MKKILAVLIFMTSVAQAMQDREPQIIPERIAQALKEIVDKQEELEKCLKLKDASRSVPDLLGVFKDECLLPNGLDCCKDPSLRSQYLDKVSDKHVRYAIALNYLGFMYKQASISALSIGVFTNKYDIGTFFVAGKDIRK